KECRAEGQVGISREELLGYMAETAEALDLMNTEYQLQHLDIKPQNLFLVHSHIKVADFGLVKDLEGMQASVTGGVTPVYAAPETSDGWVSRFSDQYSLAIVYQELLGGQRPFTGNNVRQLVLQHLHATPNLTSLPAAEQAIIARALAKNPDDRFPSCRELIKALAKAVPGPAATIPLELPREEMTDVQGVRVVDAEPRTPGPAAELAQPCLTETPHRMASVGKVTEPRMADFLDLPATECPDGAGLADPGSDPTCFIRGGLSEAR